MKKGQSSEFNSKTIISFPVRKGEPMVKLKDRRELVLLMATLHLSRCKSTRGESPEEVCKKLISLQGDLAIGIGEAGQFWYENQIPKQHLSLEEWFRDKKIWKQTQAAIASKAGILFGDLLQETTN